MAVSYPAGAQGVTSRGQRRIRAHSVQDVANHGGNWRDFRSNLGPFTVDLGVIEQQKVTGSASPATPLPGKASVESLDVQLGDVDPSCYGALHLLANLFGAYDKSTAGGGAEQWDFNVAGATAAPSYLEFLEDNDHNPRHLIQNGQAFGMSLSSSANSNLAWNFSVGAGRYFFWDDPTQTAGSGSTLPTLLGTTGDAYPDVTADKDVFIRVDSTTATTVTFSAKIGTAASYSNQQTATIGAALWLEDESGAKQGTYSRQVQILFPTGSTLTALDVFEFQAKRARWSRTLPASSPLSSVQGYLYASEEGGTPTLVCDTSFDLEISWEESGVDLCSGGEEGGVASRSGELQVTATPTRTITNLDWQKAAQQRTNFHLVLDAQSNGVVAAHTDRYRLLVVLPSCRLSGPLFTPNAGGTNRDESFTFTAGVPASSFSYDGGSYTEACHIVVVNDLSSL